MPRDDIVFYHDDLLERVVNEPIGADFLKALFFLADREGRLKIVFPASVSGGEIDFEIAFFALPGRVFVIPFHDPDVDIEPAAAKLVVEDVLHDMVFLGLPEVQAGILQADVCEIVFAGRADVLPSLDVVADRLAYQEGVGQVIEVLCYRIVGHLDPLFRSEGIGYLLGAGQRAGRRGNHVQKIVEQALVLNVVAFQNVVYVNVPEQVFQVLAFLLMGFQPQKIGHSPVGEI